MELHLVSGKQNDFKLNIQKNFFTERFIKQQNELLSGVTIPEGI